VASKKNIKSSMIIKNIILILISFSLLNCNKINIASSIDLPTNSNATRISKLEYNIPINTTFQNKEPQCWVDNQLIRVDSLQNAIYNYLKENRLLVKSLKQNEEYELRPILSIDKNTPYSYAFSVFSELGQLNLDTVIIRCKSVKSQVIGITEEVYIPFDETYTQLCKYYGWRKKLHPYHYENQYWNLSFDSTVSLINFYNDFFREPDLNDNEESEIIHDIPRTSEPPPPPPPFPIELEWHLSERTDFFIDLKIDIESLDKIEVNDVETNTENLKNIIYSYLQARRVKNIEIEKVGEYLPSTDLMIFLFVGDDVRFEEYLKIKTFLVEEIEWKEFQYYLRYSSEYEREFINQFPSLSEKPYRRAPQWKDTIEGFTEIVADVDFDSINELILAFYTDNNPNDGMGRGVYIYKKINKKWELWDSLAVIMDEDGGGINKLDPYDGIDIENGIITIYHSGGSSWKWEQEDKFKYINDDFYWINTKGKYGKSSIEWTYDEYNLLTGRISYRFEKYIAATYQGKPIPPEIANEEFFYKKLKIRASDVLNDKTIEIKTPKYGDTLYF
jgi:biopolymer transport protein ExbD